MAEYSFSDVGLQASPTYSQLLQQVEQLTKRVNEHEILLKKQKQTNETYGMTKTDDIDTNKEYISLTENEDRLFDDSTHSYLIYWYEKKSASRIVISAGVLALQTVLYSLLLIEAFHLLGRDLVNVQISYADCTDTFDPDYPAQTINPEHDNLVCDVDEQNYLYATLAFILMGSFLMYDFFACMKVFYSPKLGTISKLCAGCIILINLFSSIVASLFAFQGVYTGSGYDALINTVGVLFIHEIDEAVYKSINLIKKDDLPCKWTFCFQDVCHKYARLIVVFLFLVGMVGLGWSSIGLEMEIDTEDHQ